MDKRYKGSVGFAVLFVLLSVAVISAQPAQPTKTPSLPSLKFEKYVLPNGLQVILHQDHSIPVVAVNVWYHVGSKNEKLGRTGFAHLFEHMMFQGSEHQPGEYFAPLEKVGGSANGSTAEDRTDYWENVPANYLEMALWLEADRMGYLLPAMDQKKLDNQRDVVKNERRQGVDNEPYGKAEEMIPSLLYPMGHPYSWSVIGSHEDLTRASLDDVKDFFRNFYTPNNASLCIAGDFDPKTAKELVKKYFGDIPPGPSVERLKNWVPTLDGEKRIVVPDRVSLPRLYLLWQTTPFYTPGDAELDLLGNILSSGKTSRLYKSLVYEKQIAQDVAAYQASREMGSNFAVVVTAKQGHTLEEIQKAVDQELAAIRTTGVTPAELIQAQNNFEANFMRQLQNVGSFGGRADLLNQYNTYLGDPGKLQWDLDRYLKATPEGVKQVAEKYLDPKRRVLLTVVPQEDYQPEAVTVDRSTQPPAGPEPTFTPPKVQRAKLSNGMDVLLVEEHKLPLVQVELVLKSGWAADPKERPGAASLTAELLDEGTTTKNALQISGEVKSLGAQLGTGSFFDASTASINLLKKHLDKGLSILSDVIMHPTFPAEELERQRQIYLGRILQESKEPFTSGFKVFLRTLYGPGHPYGQPYTGSGTETSIKAIGRSDLTKYYQTYYAPNNAALVVVGDITLAEALPKLEAAFKEWKPKEVPKVEIPPVKPLTAPKVFIVDKPGAAQSVILMGNFALARKAPDYIPAQVMNNVLGGQFTSRINSNLREDKGYSYGTFSFFFTARGIGPFVTFAPVQSQSTKEAVAELEKELKAIRETKPVTADELKQSKDNLIKGYSQNFQTLGAIAGQVAEIVMYDLPDDEISRYPAEVAAVDASAAQATAKKYITPDGMLCVIVGDKSKIEAGIRELGVGEIGYLDPEGEETK